MSKLPQIFAGNRICIICEGDEEYEYLEKLISLDVWSKEYCFQLENAEGNGKIHVLCRLLCPWKRRFDKNMRIYQFLFIIYH